MPLWDSKGTVVLKKATSKGALPVNPEQLRQRLTVMPNALLMIGLHHPGRLELKVTTQQSLEKCNKDYLLGDCCFGLRYNTRPCSAGPSGRSLKILKFREETLPRERKVVGCSPGPASAILDHF